MQDPQKRGTSSTISFLTATVCPTTKRRKSLPLLIAISAGEEDMHSLPVAAEVGARLLACYLG